MPLLLALMAGSALASWMLVREEQPTEVPAVVAAPPTTALPLSVGNDPAALRVPKAKRATASSGAATAAASTASASTGSTSSPAAAAPVARAPSSGSSSSGSNSATEPAALEFGR